jgi:FlaA1/EpsC-like NDP-sugar epimerase
MLKTSLKKLMKNNAPRWVVLLIDCYIVINAFIIAYLIRFNFQLNFNISDFIIQIPLVLGVSLLSFLVVGSYKGIVRHTGVKDSILVFIATTGIAILLGCMVFLNRTFGVVDGFTIPFSILVIHYLLNIILLIASRYIFKIFYHLLTSNIKYEKKVLIYGAGASGLITYNVLNEDSANAIKIVGFIDDDKQKQGKYIHGVKVFDFKKITREFIQEKQIKEIIISIQRIKPTQLITISEKISKFGINVKIVPPVKNWLDNKLKVRQIKNLKIEDLLGRAPIALDHAIIKKELNQKIVLVTGAAGSIGSEIARQVAAVSIKKLILIDQAESNLYDLQQYFIQKKIKNITCIVGDIRNKERMEQIFQEFKPELLFHAAAYKHVPLMEENPYEAVRVNVNGTKIMADLSVVYGVEKFVMISTDKAVNPTNVMGATKRIAEMYINSINKAGTTKFITTRFGNVLGSNGSVVPLFQSQIKNGGPLTVTHKDITRYFMTIPEACQLVLEAGTMGNGGEIFVFDMGESIKIFDLAVNMIQLSGLKYPEDIAIEISGLRPGEKIKEELLGNGENTMPTYHEKIMIAKIKNQDAQQNYQKIIDLCELNNQLDTTLTVAKMKEIVPEFKSNNSEYEVLDISNRNLN